VQIRCDWRGTPPALPPRIEVASHAACDRSPIDLAEPGAATRLASYVWPDQRERLERLRAAITLAAHLHAPVERADALAWVERELGVARPGQATVLYHSIVWQYLPPDARRQLRDTIEAAGARATRAAPLAWLALEVPDSRSPPRLTLTLWPGGAQRVLAEAHAHGQWAIWR